MTATFVVATFIVKEDEIEAGKALIEAFVEPSLKQKGCLFYNVYQSNETPSEFVVVDGWETDGDLNHHATSEVVADIVGKLTPLLQQPAQVKAYRKIR